MSTLKESLMQAHPLMEEFSLWISNANFDQRRVSPELVPQSQKSAAAASELRKLGNEAYNAKNYHEALQCYTKSIAKAPTDSIELALAFGNRSAVLQLMEKYVLCLLDVNRALKGPQLSDDAKQKLVNRKNDCWTLLQAENETKQKLRKAIRTEAKRALYPIERRLLHCHQMTKNEIDLKMDYSSYDDPIWQMTFDNARTPGLSPNVELVHNEVYGYHLVATNDIMPGEVISIQEPFAIATFTTEHVLHKYCSYCTIWCEALIPCSNCALEMYCSRACYQKAYDSYHRTECKMLPYLLMYSDIQRKKVFSPLRVFLAGTKQGLDLEKLMLNPQIFDILGGREKLVNIQQQTNDYFAILHMSKNRSRGSDASMSKSSTDHHQILSGWIRSFELLECINFFDEIKKNLEDPENEMNLKLFAGLLLLHHIELAELAYEIPVRLLENSGTQITTESQWIASCFGILQGFMNHSCEANSFPMFNRRKMLTFSSRLIKSGEQIFTTHCWHYGYYSKQKRSKCLADKYGFECKCTACLYNWPTGKQLALQKLKYRTKDKAIIRKLDNYYTWLQNLMEQSSVHYKGEHLQAVLKCIPFIRQNVEEPSAFIYWSEFILYTLMESKGNQYFKASSPLPKKCS